MSDNKANVESHYGALVRDYVKGTGTLRQFMEMQYEADRRRVWFENDLYPDLRWWKQ